MESQLICQPCFNYCFSPEGSSVSPVPLAIGLSLAFAALVTCAVVMLVVLNMKKRRELKRKEQEGKYLIA